jgi:hypothetical protein
LPHDSGIIDGFLRIRAKILYRLAARRQKSFDLLFILIASMIGSNSDFHGLLTYPCYNSDALAAPVLPTAQITQLQERIFTLEEIGDIGELTSSLSRAS